MTRVNLAFDAMVTARQWHATQVRKYTGAPYFEHLAEVAGIVATVTFQEVCIAVAYLHDSIEDQGKTVEEIDSLFGCAVAEGVMWLSDMEQGNRAERKAASRARLACAPGWVQSVKCADLISNTSSIVVHDPKFAYNTYLPEKRLLLEVLTQADPRLHAIASELASRYLTILRY
jgi:guanosine-3',5'-bis(diphosphate) 3'-pyrophosphohydrolase